MHIAHLNIFRCCMSKEGHTLPRTSQGRPRSITLLTSGVRRREMLEFSTLPKRRQFPRLPRLRAVGAKDLVALLAVT
jgi:hypothetical protein